MRQDTRKSTRVRGDCHPVSIPVFGKYGLAAIKPTMVQQWVKDLQAVKGLAPSTIETIYIIFASILRGAVRDSYLRKTPCDDIRLPEITPTVIRLLAPAEVLALAAAMPRRYALLVLLGAVAGLREGEAFGLAVNQIDATAGMITVSQQVIAVDRHPVLAPPKTSASMRDVPMPLFLQDAITRHLAELALSDGDVLCRTPKRTLLRRDYYNREIWKPAWPRQEWPPTRPFMTCGIRRTAGLCALPWRFRCQERRGSCCSPHNLVCSGVSARASRASRAGTSRGSSPARRLG